MNVQALKILNRCKLIAQHTKEKTFLSDDLMEKFENIGQEATQSLLSVARLMDVSTDYIHSDKLFGNIKATGLKQAMAHIKINAGARFLKCVINPKSCVYITYPDLVKAFIFYEVTEGSYMEKAKCLKASECMNPFFNVPNPFLTSLAKYRLNDQDKNIVLHCAYAFMSALVIAANTQPAKGKIKHRLVENRNIRDGKVYTNYKAAYRPALDKLSYAQVDREVWLSHRENFESVNSTYQGSDTDDWMYFRFFEGTVNGGYSEDRYALCPSLGIKRPMTTGEYYNTK